MNRVMGWAQKPLLASICSCILGGDDGVDFLALCHSTGFNKKSAKRIRELLRKKHNPPASLDLEEPDPEKDKDDLEMLFDAMIKAQKEHPEAQDGRKIAEGSVGRWAFAYALQKECPESGLSAKQNEQLFEQIDQSGGGSIELNELQSWVEDKEFCRDCGNYYSAYELIQHLDDTLLKTKENLTTKLRRKNIFQMVMLYVKAAPDAVKMVQVCVSQFKLQFYAYMYAVTDPTPISLELSPTYPHAHHFRRMVIRQKRRKRRRKN